MSIWAKSENSKKINFKNQLLSYCEQILRNRRIRLRFKRIAALRKNTKVSLDLRFRQQFLEDKIHNDIHYFTMNEKAADLLGMDINDIKNQLRINNEKLVVIEKEQK